MSSPSGYFGGAVSILLFWNLSVYCVGEFNLKSFSIATKNFFMKKIFLILLVLVSISKLSGAQYSIQENDTSICNGTSITLHAVTDSAIGLTPFFLPDDTYSSPFNIGFSFIYWGHTYSKCLIATNGFISFDTLNALQYAPWPINDSIPNNVGVAPSNAIMSPWEDLDPSVPAYGQMSYGTFGVTPNRYFVANYCAIPMFQCNSLVGTFQIILYEGSNSIEMHIIEKNLCDTWNQGAAIQGLNNLAGDSAVVVPGRNYPYTWTAYNEAKRFTPNSNFTEYTIDSIAFAPAPILGSPVWMIDNTVIGNYISMNVLPYQETTYHLITTGCGNSDDSVTVHFIQFDSDSVVNNLTCPFSGDGSIVLNCTGTSPFNYNWLNSLGTVIQTTNTNSGTDTLNGIDAGQYLLQVTDSFGCQYSSPIQYFVFNVYQPQAFDFNNAVTNASCFTCADGSGIANIFGGTPPYNYLWNNGITTDSLNNQLPGTYILTVTDSHGCVFTDTLTIGFDNTINDFKLNNSFNLYPNPAYYNFVLEGNFPFSGSIFITDMIGRKLKEFKIESLSEKEIIDVKNFPDGIYFLSLKNDTGESWQKKFVVQH